MSDFTPTWLYLKQHNQTKLKYFGKTISDPEVYPGSGVVWTRHLKKHGNDVSTVWKQLFTSKDDLMEYAVTYSIKNNIVESKEYANLIVENGLIGGDTGITPEGRKKLSEKSGSRTHSEETKRKIREARKKQISPMLGKKHSEETKQKIREQRFNQTNIGMLGRKHSEETRQKISQAKRSKKENFS